MGRIGGCSSENLGLRGENWENGATGDGDRSRNWNPRILDEVFLQNGAPPDSPGLDKPEYAARRRIWGEPSLVKGTLRRGPGGGWGPGKGRRNVLG